VNEPRHLAQQRVAAFKHRFVQREIADPQYKDERQSHCYIIAYSLVDRK
jgi:hypothetical protein